MELKYPRKIALLINPLSGKGSSVETGEWISAQLHQKKIDHSVYVSPWPASLEDYTEIWITGGDGTVNYYLNHYKKNEQPIVLFKAGTGNDIYWKLYGDITREQHFELALSAIAKKIDIGECNGTLFINSTGFGFDGEVLRSINSIRFLGGHLGYLAVVLKKIFSYREIKYKITTGSKMWENKYLLVVVNNSSRTGGGFMVTPDALLTDGKLDLMLCTSLPVLKRLMNLPKIEKGKHLQLPFIHYSHEQSVHIEADKEVYGQIDGELIRSRIFNIRVIPARLSVKY